MLKRRNFIGLVLFLGLCYVGCGCWRIKIMNTEFGLPSKWTGEAEVVHLSSGPQRIRVVLEIAENGTVKGWIGGAIIRNGFIKKNRGWLGKKLNLNSDYLVIAETEGHIVEHESTVHWGVFIPINYESGRFMGGIWTTDSIHGISITKRGQIYFPRLVLTRCSKD